MRLKRILFLSLLLIPFSNLSATKLNITENVYITSITYTWDNYSTQYIAVLSTNNFLTYISSNTLSNNSTTYISLKGNTTYYFKVKISTEDDSKFSSITTLTYTQTPQNLEILDNLPDLLNRAQISIDFQTPNSYDTTYQIRYSSSDNTLETEYYFQFFTGSPFFPISGLLTNTTYYFKVKAYDKLNRPTIPNDFSEIISTQTLPKFPDTFNYSVFETSVTFNWTPVNGPNQEDSSYAYEIFITTTDQNPLPQLTYYFTLDVSESSHTFISLDRNTLYYFSFSVLNSIGVKNEKKESFSTLTLPPSNFKLISYTSSTATLGWDEYPRTPQKDSSQGYILEASTSTDFTNPIVLTTNTLSVSTLTLTNLKPNTTYYFRVGSLNISSITNYSEILSTITLSMVIDKDTVKYTITPRTIKAEFIPLNSQEDPYRSYGYLFTLSKTSDPYNIDFSSYTPNPDSNSLEITNLRPNTTYYSRIYTYNSAGAQNYDETTKLLTSLPTITQIVNVLLYTSDTIKIEYSTVDADGYILEVSTNRFFNTISKSSFTNSNDIKILSISGLENDTEYFIRLGSLFGDTTIYTDANPFSITTLYPPPQNPSFSNIYITSATLLWDSVISNGYSLEASTSSNFETYLSSVTFDYNNNTLTIGNLLPNTTYYFRVGTINSKNEKNYSVYLTTPTHANYPIEKPLSNLTTYSLQINWDPNSNPPDTLYIAEISSTNFADSIISSQTYNNYVRFEGLNPNTTYYQRITAISRNNITTGPIYFTPTATLAYKPINLKVSPSTHTLTLNWEDPNNASGTPYLAEISSTNFYDSIISSTTLLRSATFYNLNANTPYYLRVSALNFSNRPSEYEKGISTTYVETPKIKDPTFINILLDGFTAQWDNNTNSTHTIYIVEASTISDFSIIFKSTQTKNTIFVFPDLTPNTEYWVRVKAKGLIESNESDYLVLGLISTLYREEKNINNQINQIVSLPYSYGSIEVEIPPYSLGSPTKIFIEPVLSPPPPNSNVGKLIPTLFAARIWMYPQVVYNGKIIIRIPYKDLPQSIKKERLVIARYDEQSGLWVPLNSDVYNNYVEGETYHLSIFQIMELLPSYDISNIKIYPNPYRPNSSLGKMSFSNMPPKTEIYIYTITGDLIIKKVADENGFIQWDGKNSSGRDVASGVYIVLFKTPDGKKITKKIGIEK